MAPLHVVPLQITRPQILKLVRGEGIQLKHAHIGTGHPVHMSLTKAKGMHTAKKLGKGKRLQLTHHELKASGLGSFLKGLGKSVLKAGVSELTNQTLGRVPYVGSTLSKRASNAINDRIGGNIFDDIGGAFSKGFQAIPFNKIPSIGKELVLDQTVGRIPIVGRTLAKRGSDYIDKKAGFGVKPHMVKGSAAAKAHMASLRALRKPVAGKRGSALHAMGR